MQMFSLGEAPKGFVAIKGEQVSELQVRSSCLRRGSGHEDNRTIVAAQV